MKITKNTQKNGLEVRFDTIPAESIREALKAAGFRWSRFARCWYALDTEKNRAALDKLNGAPVENITETTKEEKTNKKPRAVDLITEAGEAYGDAPYFLKSEFDAFRAHDGRIVTIEKKHITKDFCFGEHGYDYEEKLEEERASRCFSYFENENLRPLKEELDELEAMEKDDTGRYKAVLVQHYFTTDKIARLMVWDSCRWPENDPYKRQTQTEPATAEDLKAYKEILKNRLEDMRKRCAVWWKKNGAEGLHTWTYWADA